MIHLFVKHLLLIFFYVFSTNLYADSNNQFSVATAHEIATRTGLEILKKGGNAFDAAVAGGMMLQVCEPHLNGPGGDMPAIIHSAKSGETKIICGDRFSHSSNRNGRLSNAEGSLKPCSTKVSFRERSPLYIPPSCGTVTCDSSITSNASFGK